MPTGAYARRHETQDNESHPPPPSNRNTSTTEDEELRLVQLQNAVLQRDVTTENNANNTHAGHAGNGTRGHAASTTTDGARNPVTPGTDYASLRLITRRQPQDPDALLNGMDTSSADLSWAAGLDAHGGLDPKGQPWVYPKTRGKLGSNLDEFRDEIETRTKKGEGCQTIADALIAMGVETSNRAVARQRMKWGLRQRAQRRMTEQGLANIRKAHLDHAQRLSNSDPVPVKRVRIRVLRKAEITRMTKEGLSAAQIAENLSARGVRLKRGAATVERLRTVWGLTEDTQRSVENIRGTARNRAAKAQKEQFESIAQELGVVDVDGWVRSKMSEEVARDARREYGYRLMGDARPKSTNDPALLGRNAQQQQQQQQHLRALSAERRKAGSFGTNVLNKLPGVDFLPHTFDPIFTPPAQDGMAPTGSAQGPSAMALAGTDALQEVMETSSDEAESDQEVLDDGEGTDADEAREDEQDSQVAVERQVASSLDLNVDSSTSLQPQLSALQVTTGMTSDSNFSDNDFDKPWEDAGQEGPPPRDIADDLDPADVTTQAPPPGFASRRLVNIAPRPPSLRPIAPRPLAPLPSLAQPQKPEAEYMAQFGLFPYPTHGKPPQKYLTPTGLITTEGYEYLASPAGLPTHPPSDVINIMPPPHPPHPPPPPMPPLPAKVSQIPAPPLIMSPEEVEKHKEDLKSIERCHMLIQECMDLLAARADSRPPENSLTGMPPSLRQIQDAKERLKEAASVLLAKL